MFRLPDGEDDAWENAEKQTEASTRPAQSGQGNGGRLTLAVGKRGEGP